jgi:hypothetical protein
MNLTEVYFYANLIFVIHLEKTVVDKYCKSPTQDNLTLLPIGTKLIKVVTPNGYIKRCVIIKALYKILNGKEYLVFSFEVLNSVVRFELTFDLCQFECKDSIAYLDRNPENMVKYPFNTGYK